MHIIFQALFYFLPAYCANMAPNLFKRCFPFFDRPIDQGRTFRGKRVFGDHKTYRGFVLGAAFATAIALLQYLLHPLPFFTAISLLDYRAWGIARVIILGFLLGFGALLGDALKSFCKRQAGIRPGRSWFPFDQLDFVVGGLLLSFLIFVPPAMAILAILITSPLLHIIFKFIGYLLKIDSEKF